MIRATRIWICPAICGCELNIAASWVDPAPDDDGSGRAVSFRHPVPNTITGVTVVSVCVEHAPMTTAPFPPDPYYGALGYIRPIPVSPTEGERLYIHLYRYTGQTLKPDTCDCKLYQPVDRGTNVVDLPRRHGKHSRKCQHHTADTDAGTAARENSQRKARLLARVTNFMAKNEAEFSWRYQTDAGVRVLYVTILNITVTQWNQAQAWADTNVGPGLVVVVRG